MMTEGEEKMAPIKLYAAVCVFLLTPAAYAQDASALFVDIEANGLQAGYQAFPNPGPSHNSATWTFATALGQSGYVSVTLRALPSSEHLTWRARPGIDSGPYQGISFLLSDLVFTEAAAAMQLELHGLAAGTYSMRTYHHDPVFSDHGSINVQVLDSDGSRTAATGLVQSWGTGPSDIAQANVEVAVASGAGVAITLSVVPQTGNAAVFNGFDLVPSGAIGNALGSWGAIKATFR